MARPGRRFRQTQAETLAFNQCDVGVVCEAIQERRNASDVRKDRVPVLECAVGGD